MEPEPEPYVESEYVREVRERTVDKWLADKLRIPSPNHTYDELGEAAVGTLEECVEAVLRAYPLATGGMVTGSDGHHSYWVMGRLVAHSWPAGDGMVWLRLAT